MQKVIPPKAMRTKTRGPEREDRYLKLLAKNEQLRQKKLRELIAFDLEHRIFPDLPMTR